MNKTLGSVLALSLLSFPAARAHAQATADTGEKGIQVLEGVADVVDKNKDNCDQMASELDKFQTDNADAIKAMQANKANRTEAEKKAWQDKYGDRAKAAYTKMSAGSQKCKTNEKVKTALAKFKAP